MSIENQTLSAAADLAHFRHFIRRGGFSPLLTNVCSTSVEIALQIHSILTNKPKVKYAKINVSSFITRKFVQVRLLVIQTNKPKQTQLKPKQTQFKPNLSKGQN